MPDYDINTLEKLPKSSDGHIWADYIELLCLANIDGEISKADLLDRIDGRKDLGELEELGIQAESLGYYAFEISNAEIDDKKAQLMDDWFKHLQYRAEIFKEFYPFSLSRNGKAISRKSRISLKRKLYVFFLLASNLKYNKTNNSALTKSFEIISKEALKTLMPKNAEVHVFGTGETKTGRYIGKLWPRINKLARDLGEIIILEEGKISKYDSGDNGLDVVGWVPLGDSNNSLLTLLCQCACTEKWVPKQHSSSASAWSQVMTFKAMPGNVAFIPFCFRDANGSWHKPQDIQNSILVDRVRLIYLLQNKWRFLKSLPCYSAVNEILQQHEKIF